MYPVISSKVTNTRSNKLHSVYLSIPIVSVFDNVIYSPFPSICASATDYNDDLVAGHPPGGVAIYWSKHLDQNISQIDIESCNTIIRANTVVIINGGETQRRESPKFFISFLITLYCSSMF